MKTKLTNMLRGKERKKRRKERKKTLKKCTGGPKRKREKKVDPVQSLSKLER